MSQYNAAASVGTLPTVSVTYSAENIAYMTGSSGKVPAIDPLTRQEVSNNKFKLPDLTGEHLPAVVMHGDFAISITSAKYGASSRDVDDLGIILDEVKLHYFNYLKMQENENYKPKIEHKSYK